MAQKKNTRRLLTFDLLRGYFLLSIILNHLYWYPNGFDWVAAQGNLFVTAAEGFFLISGIILGIVRGRKLLHKPFRDAALLLLKRGAQLYVTSIVLMLIFTLLGWWFFYDNPGLKVGIRPADEPFLSVLFGALSFNYIYGWADYLRLYAIFILISPLALWLLRRNKWYLVLAASVGLWLLFPASDTVQKTDELLMPLAWQLIFFSGFIIGFHWDQLVSWWQKRTARLRRAATAVIVSVAVSTICLNAALYFGQYLPGAIGVTLYDANVALPPFFDKESLPLPRLLLFGLWFWFSFWLVYRLEPFLVKRFGWLLLAFGQNSLYVYTIHAFVIFFAHLIMSQASPNMLLNFVGTLIAVGLVWVAVKTKFLMKIIPR